MLTSCISYHTTNSQTQIQEKEMIPSFTMRNKWHNWLTDYYHISEDAGEITSRVFSCKKRETIDKTGFTINNLKPKEDRELTICISSRMLIHIRKEKKRGGGNN